jgi:preprotein translocase subunit SecG
MKKVIQILAIALVILVPVILTAQPMPGDTGIGGGAGSQPIGGGAPIGGGLLIMLSLAIGYGTRKIYEIRKKVLD